jgi:23S rRNA (pseudouridine1915-N3)-methyltransferase
LSREGYHGVSEPVIVGLQSDDVHPTRQHGEQCRVKGDDYHENLKVFLYYIGKAKDQHANAMAAEFVKRTSRYAVCEMREIVPGKHDLFERHAAARRILLDPAGKAYDSARFVRLVEEGEQRGQDLVFVVGGHDGLPEGWKARADLLLSLSPMTYPHELARAMLAEQIYRAFTTLRGHPYPR